MSIDDRIGFARRGLHLLIDGVEDDDRLALVTYDGSVTVHAGLDAELDRQALHGIIEGIRPGGATDIHAGLGQGFEIARAAYDPARQNRVILLSDGQATSGITDDASILRMAEDYIGEGIGLTTIGVGRDFNVNLMRGLAERGAGNFYFLEDAAAIEEVFTEELDFFITPLALSVEISVSASPAYELGEVIGTRLWKSQGSSGSVFLPAVFLASRRSDDPGTSGRRGGGGAIFIEMIPRPGAGSSHVADIAVSYRLPDSAEGYQQTVAVTGSTAGEEPHFSHPAMALRYAMLNLYLGLRAATRAAASDYSCAAALLRRLDEAAAGFNLEHESPDIEADRALIARFLDNLAAHGAAEPDGPLGEECGRDHGHGHGEHHHDYYGCAIAGGRGGGAPLLLCAVAGLLLRRRQPGRRAG